MEVMKAIIIDDEPMAVELLSRMLRPHQDIQIVGSYINPLRALREIKLLRPDVIFLDIEMGEINGLEFAGVLLSEFDSADIVFVTAYSQYAVDAFEVNAIDYLLKPVLEKRLQKTLERLRGRTGKKAKPSEGLRISCFGKFQVQSAGGGFFSLAYPKI